MKDSNFKKWWKATGFPPTAKADNGEIYDLAVIAWQAWGLGAHENREHTKEAANSAKELKMYNYQSERPALFTEEGQREFIKFRDNAIELLNKAGAFMSMAPFKGVHCKDSFQNMAFLDRLVELGDVREITGPGTMGQHRVFISTK